MARPLRIEFPGAVYHVTSRGNARDTDSGSSPLDKVKGRLFLGGEEFGKRLIKQLSETVDIKDIKEVPREGKYGVRSCHDSYFVLMRQTWRDRCA